MTPDLLFPEPRTAAETPAAAALAIGRANPALSSRYRAYRLQQGREFLTLIPREGLRALLREMHTAAGGFDFESADGFEALARRCADLLPLPPFEVWALDFARNRSAYGGPEAPSLGPALAAEDVVTVAVTDFLDDRGVEWVASLEVRELDHRWIGTVRFHRPASAASCRTGPILREANPEDVQARFSGFGRPTLSALLRSALP